MKIIYIIDIYTNVGASGAFNRVIKNNSNISEYTVFYRYSTTDKGKNEHYIQTSSGKVIIEYFLANNYNLIHWFKASGLELFELLVKEIRRKDLYIPIVTTVCQRPSAKGLFLSPNEIKYSQKIVFIDFASYNDKIFSFIKEEQKRMIRFGLSDELFSMIQGHQINKDKKDIVFGRGSTMNKIPKDVIDVYDKIDVKNKKFCIVGCEDRKNWLRGIVGEREDIELSSFLDFEEWIKKCATFDIFLYQLPLSGYSSTDGTMTHAMLLKIPVVLYGPDAPKEAIEHGVNGFIANTLEEFIHYAKLLANDDVLRKQMGENARKKKELNSRLSKCLENYNNLYNEIKKSKDKKNIHTIPFTYRLTYLFRMFKLILKLYIKRSRFIYKAN